MIAQTDIDIDVFDRDQALAGFRHVPASNAEGVRHNTGIYLQDIPQHPLTGCATVDAKAAAGLGYFKIDVLNNGVYEGVRDEAHKKRLCDAEPDWTLFDEPAVVERLPHIRDHFDIVASVAPRSIPDLAVAIALIRPGKRHLVGRPRAEIDAEIWTQGEGYRFKKSHAVAYALSIVLKLNLMLEQVG